MLPALRFPCDKEPTATTQVIYTTQEGKCILPIRKINTKRLIAPAMTTYNATSVDKPSVLSTRITPSEMSGTVARESIFVVVVDVGKEAARTAAERNDGRELTRL